ncbi:serine/threonine protein kinase [Singulisphaera sp. PoT]|uniref:serine/threonine protein kinase n=1 Tax=Singulisphaera sp. PoT TaxID=3411797 RepID=UPI003BF5603B
MAVSTEAHLTEEKIGGFRYVRTLHPGATSVVMEVVQEATGRRFALKQLQESRAVESSERKLFEFEAKLGILLRHPNLVIVHEYFRDPHQPYFIMDLFPSYHLKLPIARPSVYPMPKRQLHRIISQTAAGLAFMHDKNWIHRDVKPENILVNKSGEVRVIDYALAMKPFSGLKKLLGSKAPRQGTASYMSPEQIRCMSPTPASDIYSFGITCYELACGRPPFRANSTAELLRKHLHERPIPLVNHNKSITNEYNDLVLNMLSKRPEDRCESLQEFLSRFGRIRIFKDDPDPQADRFGM